MTQTITHAAPQLRSQELAVTVIDTEAGFRELRADWTELLQQSGSNNFFLTWEWLHTWWQHMHADRKLHIVTVHDGVRLVALAALALRPAQWKRLVPFQVLEFLGCGNVGSDYLSVLVRRDDDAGDDNAAQRALTRHLTDTGFALELSHVNRDNASMHAAARQLRRSGWHEHRATIERCPYIALDGHTWESYLNKALGRTHRTNFKRKVKKLNQLYKLRIDEAKTHEERRAALDLLVNLHLKRRREVGGSDALHTRALQDFHEELTRVALDAGWLRLQVMWLDDAPVAAMYGFEYDKVFYFYQSGFDSEYATYSVGLVMAGLAIKSAIERGTREFDFLHGDEAYKYLWASAERELLRFHFFPPGARGALLSRLMQTRRKLMSVLKRPAGHGERPPLTDRCAPAAGATRPEASEDVT